MSIHNAAWEEDRKLPNSKAQPIGVKEAGFAGIVGDHFDAAHKPNGIDHVDDHLIHHSEMHGERQDWEKAGATFGDVDISKGVHATQTHVAKFHINRFLKAPNDDAWYHKTGGDKVDHLGHEGPMFITHQGRLHAVEGHHRIAAAIARGDQTVKGWHLDLDKNPVGYDKKPTQRPDGSWEHKLTDTECADCHDYQGTKRPMPKGWKIKVGSNGRLDRAYGSNDLKTLFPEDEDGPALTTSSPWPQATQSSKRHSYDQKLVGRSITHPHEFPEEDVDPRELHATQPKILRGGVKHYMEGKTDFGAENNNDHRLGNDKPRIYKRDDGQNLILSGHHRAARALLKGEPLRAIVIHGPWGPER